MVPGVGLVGGWREGDLGTQGKMEGWYYGGGGCQVRRTDVGHDAGKDDLALIRGLDCGAEVGVVPGVDCEGVR